MSTRGFVGYKKDGVIKGWYNHFDSYYESLGLEVLDKYKKLNNNDLNRFFGNITLVTDDDEDVFYNNHKIIFNLDWLNTDELKLQDGTSFLIDGLFCEYGYVFNLNDDIVEVYRGFFNEPQFEGQQGYEDYRDKQYYTHKVLEINRNNIDTIDYIFRNENIIYDKYEQYPYFEQEYLKSITE